MQDLSTVHNPVGPTFSPQLGKDPARFRLSEDQVNFFHEHGYTTGVRVLTDEQVEILQKELAELTDPGHPRHELFYEYHSNESATADHILFHALGAWRITPGRGGNANFKALVSIVSSLDQSPPGTVLCVGRNPSKL